MKTSAIATAFAALSLLGRPVLADPSGPAPQGVRDSRLRVNAKNVCIRADASPDSARLATVDAGRAFAVVGRKGTWVRVALDGGRTGWISQQFLSPMPPATVASSKPPAPPASSPATAGASAPAAASAGGAADGTVPSAQADGKRSANRAPSFLDDARPDPAERPNDGAPSAFGALRMLLFLLPVLALVVLGIRALKLVQQRIGVAPVSGKGLIGGLIEASARRHGGGSIRVVESVPVGGVSLHLVEVRGKVLLLGATASSVALLSEFEPPSLLPEDEFRAIMDRARADLFAPDTAAEGGLAGAVGALDESLRKAREAIARGGSRSARMP